MKKIQTSHNKILKKSKRVRIDPRGNKRVAETKLVDIELINNIKERSRLSRRWRIARKEGKPQKILDPYEVV